MLQQLTAQLVVYTEMYKPHLIRYLIACSFLYTHTHTHTQTEMRNESVISSLGNKKVANGKVHKNEVISSQSKSNQIACF